MRIQTSSSHLVESISAGLPVPGATKVGAVVIAVGLGFDLAVHSVLHATHDVLIGAFPLGEHLAHLVVVIGMVIVLAGIVADGTRPQRRQGRQEGTTRHAIR